MIADGTRDKLIAEWLEDWGEDSDFFRVRVKGLPPRASDLQFIDSERVYEAQKRPAQFIQDDPLIVGVDIARGGGDNNYFRFRHGLDAQSIPPIRIPGEETRDSTRMVSKLLDVMSSDFGGVRPSVAFCDGTGIGGPIVDRCKQLGHDNIVEVQFGWAAPEARYANMRAYMWGRMKDWLLRGSIDRETQLEMDLVGPAYKHDSRDRVVLEAKEDMKKRGLASPDSGDALALTFAQPVALRAESQDRRERRPRGSGWMS